ncbi:MAG: hypothetical protein CVU44_14205 [Chloroflexi bacterium HGW-Chloroflexi-6]|nr:MAG: hypothetical protein CVU44_14205 [Chloroflexi bacterium HGW-Chloroflexi-6]
MKAIRTRFGDILNFAEPMPESLRRKKMLDFMLWGIGGMTFITITIFFFYAFSSGKTDNLGIRYVLIGAPIFLVCLAIVSLINHISDGYWAGILFVGVVFLGCILDEPAQVAQGRSLLYFSIPIVLSSLVILPWASFFTAVISSIIVAVYVFRTPGTVLNPTAIVGFFILAFVMWLATSGLENAIRRLNLSNRALRESEARYRSLVEISPDVVVVSDLQGTIEMVNQAFLELIGCDNDTAVIGKNAWDFINPGDHEKVTDWSRQVILGEIPKAAGLEVLINKKDGGSAYLEIKMFLICDAVTGSPERTIGVGRDITLRKTAEQELRGERDRLEDTVRESDLAYQNLVEKSNQGMILIQESRIIKANQAFSEIFGLTLEKLYNSRAHELQDMIHPDDMEVTLLYARQQLAGDNSGHRETRLILENGQVRWIEFAIVRVSFMGQPAVQLTVIDQTERKQVELALAQSVEQLKGLEISLRDAKEDLEVRVAERTAELNTRREQLRELTRQLVTVQENERRRVSRELHDEAGQILIGLKYRLGEALSSLPGEYEEARQRIVVAMTGTDLAMGKIRTLAHDLRPPSLDVAGINLSLQGYCQEFAEQAAIPVKYKGTEPIGLTDEISISLYRILQEGLTNIAKHAQKTTQVNVTLSCNKTSVTLTISDNGSGFHPAPNQKGIGLLGIQERLSLLGGQLQITPDIRRGTRLKAIIPLFTEAENNKSSELGALTVVR